MLRAILNLLFIFDASVPPEIDDPRPLIYAFNMNSEEYVLPAPEYHEGAQHLSIGNVIAARSVMNNKIYLTHSPESTTLVRVLDCNQRFHSMLSDPDQYWDSAYELPAGSQTTVSPGVKMLVKDIYETVHLYIIYAKAPSQPPLTLLRAKRSGFSHVSAPIDVLIIAGGSSQKTGDDTLTITSDDLGGEFLGQLVIERTAPGNLNMTNRFIHRISLLGSTLKSGDSVAVQTSSTSPLKITVTPHCYLILRSSDAPLGRIPAYLT